MTFTVCTVWIKVCLSSAPLLALSLLPSAAGPGDAPRVSEEDPAAGLELYEVCESNNGNLTTLSVEQRDAINKLAVEMDYSILKETNRCWLLHNLLQDAVSPHLQQCCTALLFQCMKPNLDLCIHLRTQVFDTFAVVWSITLCIPLCILSICTCIIIVSK